MTPAERLRKHQRSLEKTQRELDRERTKLENQEKKLIQEIKKSAKNGQMGACKIQAKDLVRTRRYIEKFYSMRTQLQAISLRIQVRYLSHFWFWVLGERMERWLIWRRVDCEDERADDASYERRNRCTGEYESQYESPGAAENSDGV